MSEMLLNGMLFDDYLRFLYKGIIINHYKSRANLH